MRIGLFVLLVSFSICATHNFFEVLFGPRLRVYHGELPERNEIPWAALLRGNGGISYCLYFRFKKSNYHALYLKIRTHENEEKYRDTLETILETMIGSDCTRYPCKRQKFHRVKNVRKFSM
ncbi:hypothetical protein COOONC_24228 [Cooperia oncophora]